MYFILYKKIVNSNGSSLSTYYLRDASGKELAEWDMVNNSWIYYAYGRDRVAELEGSNGIRYFNYDYLGSVRVVYNVVSSCSAAPVYRLNSMSDYYAFGKLLRNFNGNKYGYQGSEKNTELGESDYYTHFRGLDVEIGRWKGVDPKNNFSFSPYSSMNNNPVVNTDVLGDSIRLGESFRNNIGAMTAYVNFLKTNAGKKFLTEYGEGGKSEHIAVVLMVGKMVDARAGAETSLEVVKDGKAEGIDYYEGATFVPNGQTLANNEMNDGSYLRFNITVAWGGRAKEASKGVYAANDIETLIHEPQHIKITLKTLRESSTILGARAQHSEMNKLNGEYYNERYDEYLKNINLWYSDYMRNLGTSKEIKTVHEYIKTAVLAQD